MIRKPLTMHQNLLKRVIKDQSGTLTKSLLEGIMNAFEANSPSVHISVSEDGTKITIEDTGRGFQSLTEIEEWFEKFGTPHDDSEHKIWAEYRMGRGQMFSFGKNTWRSGQFQMIVDIDNTGLSYDLTDNLPEHQGCKIEIELYKPAFPYHFSSIDSFRSAMKKQIEFIEGQVFFNGERLNTPASTLTWDKEDDNAYYMFGKLLELTFYNLGAYVMTAPASYYGLTGVVVSKQKLKVNFARNDIIYDCPIFNQIKDVLQENRIAKIRKPRRSFDTSERISTLRALRDGEIDFNDIRGLGLIELVNEKMISLDAIRQIRQPWSFAQPGNEIADTLMYSQVATIINADLLSKLDFPDHLNEETFFNWLLKLYFRDATETAYNNWQLILPLYKPMSELSSNISPEKQILPAELWTPAERRILRALQSYDCWEGRVFCIGNSETALAWTDGQTFIALARSYLQGLSLRTTYGCSHLVMTAFHELAHDDNNEDGCCHGLDFYRRFYELVSGYGSNYSKTYIMADLSHKLAKLKSEDHHTKVIKRYDKAIAARNKKLGLS